MRNPRPLDRRKIRRGLETQPIIPNASAGMNEILGVGKKIQRIITVILGIPMLGSLLIALFASGGFHNAPKSPDPATGHTIPFSARGIGTVYLDASEWSGIAPYWNTFYVFLGFFLAFFAFCVLYEAYQGFMQGWRADPERRKE